MTSVANAIRDLFTGACVWTATAWCVGILAVAYVFAMASHRCKIS